ncbi:unnamed protein product [Staurois parvus]|uniref:Uncharacterized protein n=1 Tax=Staurois parvus TaxID=386267 RepID=A0ABN9FCC4_9NEOB|nr:unnamed protein product [Staurois parvus]
MEGLAERGGRYRTVSKVEESDNEDGVTIVKARDNHGLGGILRAQYWKY